MLSHEDRLPIDRFEDIIIRIKNDVVSEEADVREQGIRDFQAVHKRIQPLLNDSALIGLSTALRYPSDEAQQAIYWAVVDILAAATAIPALLERLHLHGSLHCALYHSLLTQAPMLFSKDIRVRVEELSQATDVKSIIEFTRLAAYLEPVPDHIIASLEYGLLHTTSDVVMQSARTLLHLKRSQAQCLTALTRLSQDPSIDDDLRGQIHDLIMQLASPA